MSKLSVLQDFEVSNYSSSFFGQKGTKELSLPTYFSVRFMKSVPPCTAQKRPAEEIRRGLFCACSLKEEEEEEEEGTCVDHPTSGEEEEEEEEGAITKWRKKWVGGSCWRRKTRFFFG